MMLWGFAFTVLAALCYCNAQVAFSRILPYDPRYVLRSVPVRRSVDTEYQRIRLPISRYFPQVDTPVIPATYVAAQPIAYRLPNGEVYAIPSAWTDDDDEDTSVAKNGDNDYNTNYNDNYEYDNEYSPVYGRPESNYPAGDVYGTPQEESEPTEDLYNGLVANYFLGKETPPLMDQENLANVKRRKETAMPINKVIVEKKSNVSETSATEKVPIAGKSQDTSTSTPSTSAPEKLPTSTLAPKVAAPMSRIHKSGEQVLNKASVQQGMWENFDESEKGQKEVPFYRVHQRPIAFHTAERRRQPISLLQDELSRDKNIVSNKNALPMIEKLMAAAHHRSSDPLTEQLDSLKFRNM